MYKLEIVKKNSVDPNTLNGGGSNSNRPGGPSLSLENPSDNIIYAKRRNDDDINPTIGNITRTKQFIDNILHGDLQKYSNCYSHIITTTIPSTASATTTTFKASSVSHEISVDINNQNSIADNIKNSHTVSANNDINRCKDKRLLYLAFTSNIDNDVLIADAKV